MILLVKNWFLLLFCLEVRNLGEKMIWDMLALHNSKYFNAFLIENVTFRVQLYTALSFKVEIMIYCPLPDSLRIGYFFYFCMSGSYSFIKIYFFVIFGEENVKVR